MSWRLNLDEFDSIPNLAEMDPVENVKTAGDLQEIFNSPIISCCSLFMFYRLGHQFYVIDSPHASSQTFIP